MKLSEPRLTIHFSKDGAEIEIEDYPSSTIIVKIRLTAEQLCAVLSNQAYVKCEGETGNLARVGLKMENKRFEFEISETLSNSKFSMPLNQICLRKLEEAGMSEWIPDLYYGSQDSFFIKDGKHYASAIIRRWI